MDDGEIILKMFRVAAMQQGIDRVLEGMHLVDVELLEEILAQTDDETSELTLLIGDGVGVAEDFLRAVIDFKKAMNTIYERAEEAQRKEDEKRQSASSN